MYFLKKKLKKGFFEYKLPPVIGPRIVFGGNSMIKKKFQSGK